MLAFDLFNLDGILGDKFPVNGVIQPVLHVHPPRCRFRWLNSGPSRFYQICITYLNNLSANISSGRRSIRREGDAVRPHGPIADRTGIRKAGLSRLGERLGYSPQALIATLARAVPREDAGFHAYQMLEAGVRQFTAWGGTDEGRHILIAVARYLAAHSPTERAALQTADIARRLTRGAELHQQAGAS